MNKGRMSEFDTDLFGPNFVINEIIRLFKRELKNCLIHACALLSNLFSTKEAINFGEDLPTQHNQTQ